MGLISTVREWDRRIDAKCAFPGGGCVKGILYLAIVCVLIPVAGLLGMAIYYALNPSAGPLFGGR